MKLLSVNKLSVSRGPKQVLRNVSLEIAQGEFVGLLGPNGAGKSTLLKAILNLVNSTGSIQFQGNDGRLMREIKRARYASYLPQEREVNWPITVKNIVSLGQTYSSSLARTKQSNKDEVVVEAMRRMDVLQLQDRRITELSGGEQARVLIARALAQDTQLLLADEPAAGLDPAHQISLMKSLHDLTSEGKSVVACLHEIPLAARWCSRIVVLNSGAIVADGSPEEVLNETLVSQVYGVQTYRTKTDDGLLVVPTTLIEHETKSGGDYKWPETRN
ncbi:MAG: ABC transporter ATP-binding protein [Pseudomonadota bacterium]